MEHGDVPSLRLGLYDVVLCLSEAVDLVNPLVSQHHRQVAMLSYAIGRELGFSQDRLLELTIAAALHDVGALSLADRLNGLNFEVENPSRHTECGYQLLLTFPPFTRLAEFVRYHHNYYNDPRCAGMTSEVPIESHIIHLADRIAVFINPSQEILAQGPFIIAHIRRYARLMFDPQLVWVFECLADRDSFWINLRSGLLEKSILQEFNRYDVELTSEQMMGLARLFTRIIDFRSPFTASHSTGVAFVAEALARKHGFSSSECQMMALAGFFHDLGKLGVSAEILSKPGPLSAGEKRLVRRHSYYTDRVLKRLPALDDIRTWAGLHHERLNGSGYPYGLNKEEIPLGARIMAAADVYSALTEDRPYRPGLNPPETARNLKQQVVEGLIDPAAVEAVMDNIREIEETRMIAKYYSEQEYNLVTKIFRDNLDSMNDTT